MKLNDLVAANADTIEFKLNGETISAFAGETIIQAAKRHGVDIPLDFDTLQPYGCFIGSAAVIILSQHDKARDAALNLMRFFEHESCGQCTPCRVGTSKAAKLMEAPKWNQALLEELNIAMADASICGLGQAAPNPIRCVAKHFPDEV